LSGAEREENMVSVGSETAREEFTNSAAAHAGRKEIRMKRQATEYVTLVEVLEVTVPFEEFQSAIDAVAERLEAEGVKELVSINFYGESGSNKVGAILTFSDSKSMLKHMDMVSSWKEYETFFSTVKPLDVRVYGTLDAEAEAWIGQFGDIVSRKFEHHTAGFVR
jgi:hypothetical protein